ncbi:MAG: hypothetical protein P8Y02_14050, partial [Deinococcales bacterium]
GADGVMVLRRGFAVAPGQQIVIVEDVVTTGRSTREVIDVLTATGADVARWTQSSSSSKGANARKMPYVRPGPARRFCLRHWPVSW